MSDPGSEKVTGDASVKFYVSESDDSNSKEYDVATPYSKKKQILATFCATLGCLLNGAVIGYTGPAIPSLMNKTENGGQTLWGEDIILNAQDASWITGLLSIGCFVGCVMAGVTMEKFGRKINLLVFTSVLYLLGFALILLAVNPGMVLAGRFFNGMGLGYVLATTSVYIVEIATTDMRGFLGCFVQFLGSFGVLILFSAGCFLNWWQLTVVMIVLVIPFVIGMYNSPESPMWLFSKGRDDEGRAALEWLRGTSNVRNINLEISAIKKELERKQTSKVSVSAMKEKSVLKPFAISMMMMFFVNCSGLNVMIFYCNSIFFYSRTNISSDLASVIVGFTLLFSCVLAIVFITRMGRKVILITSMAVMSICYFLLGGCFYIIEQANIEPKVEGVDNLENFPSWLPPLSIIILLFVGNGGYGTLIWVVTAELLPPNVRSIANSFIICFAFIMGFIVSKTFVDLVIAINASGTFWLYASVCVVGTIYTAVFVPETKGRTVEEIKKYFQ